MEKIEKFSDSKIENMQKVYGGRSVQKYATSTGEDELGDSTGSMRDKQVTKNNGDIRYVTDLETWFSRD